MNINIYCMWIVVVITLPFLLLWICGCCRCLLFSKSGLCGIPFGICSCCGFIVFLLAGIAILILMKLAQAALDSVCKDKTSSSSVGYKIDEMYAKIDTFYGTFMCPLNITSWTGYPTNVSISATGAKSV